MRSVLLLLAFIPFTTLSAQQKSLSGAYLTVKDNLVANDSVSTKKSATALVEAIGNMKMKGVAKDSAKVFAAAKAKMLDFATKMSATQNVNRQREFFSGLSQSFWKVASLAAMPADLYYQRCPMTGVTWVSNEKAIKNPYYPKNMLTCGEVIGEKGATL
ncbi:DUF3347 domain-containing protein [Chitinophaga horti]|uniref:DUF3347 domain-containing protein n=1 Tax=Chitinophaga horti TaxID=2920382 RepID=A0ABY6J925_9BACT|nr:DUF3347 domain-containing protein [Chitinophaga horti]UYQ95836.1 DUF3347 domain-containing protein [Chitinophaga horti]